MCSTNPLTIGYVGQDLCWSSIPLFNLHVSLSLSPPLPLPTSPVFIPGGSALSAVYILHAQSADLSRVTPKDSDRHSANHPVDLKYRPTTRSHYAQ